MIAGALMVDHLFLMTGVPYVVRLAFGLRRPRNGVRGMDLAGRVEAVGRSVQGLEPGDAVFGRSSTGTLAEYTRAPADNFAPKPATSPASTFADPVHYSSGFPYVAVNGTLVVDGGKITAARPGRVLLGPGAAR